VHEVATFRFETELRHGRSKSAAVGSVDCGKIDVV
jgi:hypothetical protein